MDWNCAPTCIGSLPHTRADKALDLVLEQLKEVPYWPQLPSIGFGENMYAQFSSHLPGIKIDPDVKRVSVDLSNYDPEQFYMAVIEENVDHFHYDEDNFHGFFELMGRELPSGIKAVKGQVVGPISAGLQIIDQNGKSAIYDDAYGEIIRKGLNLCAKWQVRQLKTKCDNVILFMDEPSLSLVGTPFAPMSHENVVAWMNEVFEGLHCIKGVHCCGNTDWPMVLSTNTDLLSFDAYGYGFTIPLFSGEVRSFVERGGILVWGIVPNMDGRLEREDVPSLLERFERTLDDLVAKGLDRDMVLRQSMLTPQCGLGGLEEDQCLRVMHLLNSLSWTIREKYGLE